MAKTFQLLPDTDLARIALRPFDEKRDLLQRFYLGRPTHSWMPFREALPAIYNAQKSLVPLPTCSWAEIEGAINRQCKSHPHWLEGNVYLAKLLFGYVRGRNAFCVEKDFFKVPIGFGARLKLWNDFYSVEDGVPIISFIDPRRGNGLDQKFGMRFVFSAMYHNLAVADFEDAQFEILRFPVKEGDKSKQANKSRSIRRFLWDINEVVPIDILNSAIQETYDLWFEILAEREEKRR